MIICGHPQSGQTLSCPTCTFPAKIAQGDGLLSCFNSQSVNSRPFYDIFSSTFFTSLCFFLMVLPFEMALHSTSTKVLPSERTAYKENVCSVSCVSYSL